MRNHRTLVGIVLGAAMLLIAAPSSWGQGGTGYTIVGWNDLGMHCIDNDFSVMSILPPYNNLHAQVTDPNGNLVTSGITVTYQGVADSTGSINTTSIGKTNFFQYAQALLDLAQPLTPDVGLQGYAMPGAANTPQTMDFDATNQWYTAEAIPLTPLDNSMNINNFPLFRIEARDPSGTLLAYADVVLPISSEINCGICHGSNSDAAARPTEGWVNNPDPKLDFRLNILRLHDDKNLGNSTYTAALTAQGYETAGLYATANGGTPILCASCHRDNALGTAGYGSIPQLTTSMHTYHATVVDPTTGQTMEQSTNRATCYHCHPGPETQCLRGAMGSAVASNGSDAMQCQSCHGSMATVGNSTREGWLDEPACQNCHTGTATQNNGQIRYTSAFTTSGQRRTAVNQTFATNPNTPAAGLDLYRFSTGHGDLQCEACHGPTHAVYPVRTTVNDNVESTEIQGHEGMLVECSSCHSSGVPSTVTGGPHGMHPVGQDWVGRHSDVAEGNATACQACHGTDYRGTVLSHSQADRTLSAFGTKNFWRGFRITCYSCHAGPGNDHASSNTPAQVSDASASTSAGTSVAIPLTATDPDGDTLTLRVVSQPTHGRTGLSGRQATYFPDPGFTGADTFTYAAFDGSTDSNLGTVTVTVATTAACTVTIDSTSVPATASIDQAVTFSATVSTPGCIGAPTYAWAFGDGATSGASSPSHTYSAAGTYAWSLTVSLQGSSDAASGDISVVTTCQPPSITTQPASRTIASGDTTTLTVAAAGTAPLSTQWYQGSSGDTGTPVAGATGTSFTTGALTETTRYWVRVSNSCGSADSATAVVTVSTSVEQNVYLVPAVAHNPGANNTLWRTALAVANLTDQRASFSLTFLTPSTSMVRSQTLEPGNATEWNDVLANLFGVASDVSTQGAIQISSNQPLSIGSVDYNQTSTGTFGQGIPALTAADAITFGMEGVLLPLRNTSAFHTNVGIVNLGEQSETVVLRLFDAAGNQVGNTRTVTAGPGLWIQQYDIFRFLGAQETPFAYLTIRVQTQGGMIWAYASVVDNTTGDPTTVPVQTR